jgi:hypothetical protein
VSISGVLCTVFALTEKIHDLSDAAKILNVYIVEPDKRIILSLEV